MLKMILSNNALFNIMLEIKQILVFLGNSSRLVELAMLFGLKYLNPLSYHLKLVILINLSDFKFESMRHML